MEKIIYLLRLQVDPEWTDENIKPLHERRSRAKGQIVQAAYRVLKAARAPLKTYEMARLVTPIVGIERSDSRAISQLSSVIAGTLANRWKEGMVERIDGSIVRWLVRHMKWQPPSVHVAYERRSYFQMLPKNFAEN